MKNELEIKVASGEKDAVQLAQLAEVIWQEHYTPIIGEAQVAYMLEKYQSAEKILEDMTVGGYRYYMAYWNGQLAGYCGIKPGKSGEGAFLSKLYVAREFRKKGISRQMVRYLAENFASEKDGFIWLTVNKNNTGSIAAYKKMGFVMTKEQVTDIGGGFVMDDYVLRRQTYA